MCPDSKTAAFFDIDRTLVPGRTMERLFLPFLIRKRYCRASDLARYLGYLARNLGEMQGQLIHANKYHLKDKDARELERLAAECFQRKIRPLVSPAGRRAVEEHRRAGHLVVLVTGTLQPLAEQLRRELGADLVLAARLAESRGQLCGTLANPRPYGPEKARLVREVARRRGLDLQCCYAYGDHRSDVHLLEAVGNPRAVNPDPALRIAARRRGWPILNF